MIMKPLKRKEIFVCEEIILEGSAVLRRDISLDQEYFEISSDHQNYSVGGSSCQKGFCVVKMLRILQVLLLYEMNFAPDCFKDKGSGLLSVNLLREK